MHNFLKQKFYRKLFNILKYKRNGRIRSSISFVKKKIELNPVLVYKQNLSFLRHIDFSSFSFEPSLSSSLSSFSVSNSPIVYEGTLRSDNKFLVSSPQILEKKKYYLNSFLFSSLCHYSRKRPIRFLDDDVLRTYFTIPYRFSLTRFLTYRVLFRYYSIRVRSLSSLRKHILSRSSKLHGAFVKKWIISLEERLDNTLLRLFHFKSLFTLKRSPLRFHKVKSPWGNFSIARIKQQLNHGHFLLNGNKVASGNVRITLFDTLSFSNTFLSNPFWSNSSSSYSSFFSQLSSVPSNSSFSHLILFRHLYSLSPDFSFWHKFFHSPIISEINFLCQHLKNFHLKRFTEIFFLSYKNFHLFSRVSSSSPFLIETLIKPFISSFSSGANQSLFFLWPLLSLLSFISWGPSIQRNLIRSNCTSRNFLQKNLHDLFILKKFQTQFFSSSTTSSLPNHFLIFSTLHPSLFSVKSLFCYASVLYGTRKCKWINLQQRRDSFFFKNFYNKINFFELELDFFQLSFRISSF